ncbi:hypothetical protein KEJ32_07000 [Candidatus Bathyarchaeota archaeon]|nr:hypothetical protein [Candidatus Bathyarchaeota archaeon]MBS7635979.1 hypothetical protein [Candidatus Bathyarchaeota archaeon]
MKKNLVAIIVVNILLLIFAFTNRVYAAEESFPSRFLGSPLLVLTAIIIIDIIAYLYRKIRK